MKHLIEGSDKTHDLIEGRTPSLVELSDADIDQVTGAGCWMTGTSAGSGTGIYPHSAYPEKT